MIFEALCYTISLVLLVLFGSQHNFEDEDYSVYILLFAVGSLVLSFLSLLYCFYHSIKNYIGSTFLLLSIVFQISVLSDIIALKGCFQVDASIFLYITFSLSISTVCLASTSMINQQNNTDGYKKVKTSQVFPHGLRF